VLVSNSGAYMHTMVHGQLPLTPQSTLCVPTTSLVQHFCAETVLDASWT
jgi:hypothetical protein